MISYIMKKIVGSQNEREIKRLGSVIDIVNEYEESLLKLKNIELKEKTDSFIEHVKNSLNGSSPIDDENTAKNLEDMLEDMLPEAFAVVREAARRTLGMRPFDVQLIGGLVLHQGKIAEMKTGEGKTLVAALPLFLNGLTGFGAHLVTVNDYLARRDATWMGSIHKFLGLSVGVVNHDVSYLIEWENPEKAQQAIDTNLSVWPAEYADMEIPPEKNLEVLSAFKTTLVECSRKLKKGRPARSRMLKKRSLRGSHHLWNK